MSYGIALKIHLALRTNPMNKLRITKRQKKILDNFLFLGVVIHEFAHYIVVLMMPTTDVKDAQLSRHDDSYVQYEMIRPRIYKMILIGFAPFYVNTTISLYFVYRLVQLQIDSYQDILIFPILYYLSIVTAAKALPSTQDASAPIDFMKEKLFSRRLPLILVLGPIYLIICLPALALAKLRMKSLRIYYGMGLSYSAIVLVTGVLTGLGYLNYEMVEPIVSQLRSDIRNIYLDYFSS